MKKTIAILVTLILFSATGVHALNLGKVVAYPVPFNPNAGSGLLKLLDKSGSVTGPFSVTLEIFDINGDKVLGKNYSGVNLASALNPVVWNGRNGAGKKVKPGFYIIKLTVEDPASNAFSSTTIRILIDY
ncbi:MAG: hypothetical protein EPN93_17925 [Spirochaetes bacterium]|nr:MAG: hypothetical protein EPN93_17925 [Spirochaetota bacterium]